MASPTQLSRIWVNSGSWWWTGKPGMLHSMELRRVRHDWVTELNWTLRRAWQLTLVFFPGKSYGQRSLTGSSTCGCKSQTQQKRLNISTFNSPCSLNSDLNFFRPWIWDFFFCLASFSFSSSLKSKALHKKIDRFMSYAFTNSIVHYQR